MNTNYDKVVIHHNGQTWKMTSKLWYGPDIIRIFSNDKGEQLGPDAYTKKEIDEFLKNPS